MKLAVCPYCLKKYNVTNNTWVTTVKMKLTELNHYFHMCDECAEEKGVDYYQP